MSSVRAIVFKLFFRIKLLSKVSAGERNEGQIGMVIFLSALELNHLVGWGWFVLPSGGFKISCSLKYISATHLAAQLAIMINHWEPSKMGI